MINFDDLFKAGKVVKDKIRRGRGESSKGKTSGRGGKGQTARSGHKIIRGFEGGQTPLHMRLPKKGFTSHVKNDVNLINLDRLVAVLRKISDLPSVLNKEYLLSIGVIRDANLPVKLVSSGSLISKEIKKDIKFDVEFSSKSASGFLLNTSVSS